MENYNKIEVFEEEVRPLVDKILEICGNHDIQFNANYLTRTYDDGKMSCVVSYNNRHKHNYIDFIQSLSMCDRDTLDKCMDLCKQTF